MTKALGTLLLVFAATAGAIGLFWAYLDAVGTEWDYCRRGDDCIAGSTIGITLIVLAALAGVIGVGLLRRPRR